MDKVKDDGGPAFPGMDTFAFGQDTGWHHGLSLRDWFAGMAMQGFLSSPDLIGVECRTHGDKLAAWSYDVADAMLEARRERERGRL